MGSIDRQYPHHANIKERRRRFRYPVDFEVSLWPKMGSSQIVRLIDLSVDGACIEPRKPVEVKSTGILLIEGPQGPLRLPYSVVRLINMNGLKRAGLAFFLMDSVRLQLAATIDALTGG
jgi:hypothetical protein